MNYSSFVWKLHDKVLSSENEVNLKKAIVIRKVIDENKK